MAVLGGWDFFYLLSIIFPAPSWHLHLFETNCRIICFSNFQEVNSWFQGGRCFGHPVPAMWDCTQRFVLCEEILH